MQLVNHTPVPAELHTSTVPNTPNRRGWLTAKATYRFDRQRAELDGDDPRPVLTGDEIDGDAMLPADITVRGRQHFEVMLVGAAELPEGETATRRQICMTVGDTTRAIELFGDRQWQPSDAGPVMSEPLPFARMPLSWRRAFGGSAVLEIDRGAKIVVREPNNPFGRGFDVDEHARILTEAMKPPPGYPIVPSERLLPNLEDPDALIAGPQDAPRPSCWAPMPYECALRVAHVIDGIGTEPSEADHAEIALSAQRHAHPDWWIRRPRRGDRLKLRGIVPEGDVDLELPPLRIFGDYVAGDRRGSRELVPQSMVVFASEKRFCITYRLGFYVSYEPGTERCFRLRLEEGWHGEDVSNG